MKEKLMTMSQAVDLVEDGQLLALGGNSLHRSPVAFGFQLAKKGFKSLKACAAAPGIATDVLCATYSVDTIYFGFFGFENEYGLALGMRKGVQEGRIRPIEGACTAMIHAMRAGAYGVPFLPVAGMFGSDLLGLNPDFYFTIKSPLDGKEVVCVKALHSDWAVIHVQEADKYGNARILGSDYQDVLMTRSAKKTIITAEKIVDTESFQAQPKLTSVPHFLVEAVVHAPHGARPGICFDVYETVDDAGMKAYLKAVKDDKVSDYLSTI
jgi:glutaconate CoA-transferase subunit A